MNKQKLNIWGREFELEIVFDCYGDEEILESQKEALAGFLADAASLTGGALQQVKEYCIEHDPDEIGAAEIENIFKYVKPKSLYIQRTADGARIVGLMCAYKFDIDNGIAAVFKNGILEKVGTQNIIL